MDLNIAYDMTLVRTYQKSRYQVAFPLDTFRAPEQCSVLHFERSSLHTKVQALHRREGQKGRWVTRRTDGFVDEGGVKTNCALSSDTNVRSSEFVRCFLPKLVQKEHVWWAWGTYNTWEQMV